MISLLTGANSGIGLETALGLAKAGHHLVLTVRDQAKAEQTRQAILAQHPATKLDIHLVDLADIPAVARLGKELAARYPRLDRLLCNAGYIPGKMEYIGPGYEKSFIANHLGHFVLLSCLLPSLEASDEARVISVSSDVHPQGKASRFFALRPALNPLSAYSDGKLANILFTQELARRTERTSVRAYCLHPGVVSSGFGSALGGIAKLLLPLAQAFMTTPAKGALTSIYLATVPESVLAGHNGAYFNKRKPTGTSSKDITPENARTLWLKSEEAMAGLLA